MDKDQLHAQVDATHRYARPEYQETMDAMSDLRDAFNALAHAVVNLCPVSREQSLALTKLDEANMFAIASLARHEPKGEKPNVTSHPKRG